jgi:hypothetical protein
MMLMLPLWPDIGLSLMMLENNGHVDGLDAAPNVRLALAGVRDRRQALNLPQRDWS